MRHVLSVLVLISAPFCAFADPTLPPADALKAAATPEFLHELVNASVAGVECPGFEATEGEVALMLATIPLVVADLGIDNDTYELDYYGQAYADIFIDETCPTDGPKVRPLLDKLTALGGVAG